MYCPFISSKYCAKCCFSKTLHETAAREKYAEDTAKFTAGWWIGFQKDMEHDARAVDDVRHRGGVDDLERAQHLCHECPHPLLVRDIVCNGRRLLRGDH